MQEIKHVKIELADPTPLGLMGLAMVTLVASSQKLGITEGLSFVLPWVIFLGAIAQIIAGILDFKHNNLFGASAFCSYGLFWCAIAMAWLIKMGIFGETLMNSADTKQLGIAFIGYLIYSIFIMIGAFRLNTYLSVIMIFINILFIALTAGSFCTSHFWHYLTAYTELIIAILSFYGAGASFVNKSYSRVLLPMGKPWTK